MAILGNFEITILTPTIAVSKITGLVERQWQPLEEYAPPRSDEMSATNCHKYIGLPSPPPLQLSEEQLATQPYQYTNTCEDRIVPLRAAGGTFTPVPREEPLEFAIDYKVHCGFSFLDPDQADLIIFRTYLDGERIGSGLVKRERWERSGSYRVRKRGKRLWTGDCWNGHWVQQKWVFEPGRHGTLIIEAWRENENNGHSSGEGLFKAPRSTSAVGSYGAFDNGRVTIDLTEPGDGQSCVENVTKTPRVKRTRKVDMWPMATFVFDYRTEDTLRNLGIIQVGTPAEANDNDIEIQQVRPETPTAAAAATAVEVDGIEAPLQPLIEGQQQPIRDYNISQFWNSPDRPSTSLLPLLQSDEDYSFILDSIEAEYEQFSSVQRNSENLRSRQSEPVVLTEDTAGESLNEMVISEPREVVDIGLLGQGASVENELPRNRSIEVVDLTMFD